MTELRLRLAAGESYAGAGAGPARRLLTRRTRCRWWVRLSIVVFCLAAPGSALAGTSPGNISINDVSVVEGNYGTTTANFTVTCSHSQCTSQVDYTTNPGTAQAPADYQHTQGTLNFDNGIDSLPISVPVNGDTTVEQNETFTVRLTAFEPPDTITDGTGQGTILNDDGTGGGSPDSDGDGVPDSSDQCPTVFAMTPNGCPPDTAGQPDSDGDGVPNATDACPLVAGSGPDGCPLGGMLPPPGFGSSVNLSVLEDDVFIKLPAGSAAGGRAGAAQRGQGFVPLVEPRQVPVGTLVDTTDGRLRLESARDATGGTQFANFSDGLFQVLQARRAGARTVLRLKGSSFRRCRVRPSGLRASAAGRRLSRRTVRRLTSNARGNFRSRGRHSAATVRGTIWVTTDRCDGTLTRVKRGRVTVRDFRRRRTIVVRPGKPYLARAPG